MTDRPHATPNTPAGAPVVFAGSTDLTGTRLDLGRLANPRRTRWVEPPDLAELPDAG